MSRNECGALGNLLQLFLFTFIFNILLFSSLYCCILVRGRTKRLFISHLGTYFLLSQILSKI